MGYAVPAVKYLKYYANIAEDNAQIAENPTEYQSDTTTPEFCGSYEIMVDIHPESEFEFYYEYKTDVDGSFVLWLYKNNTLMVSENKGEAAAYQAAQVSINDSLDWDFNRGDKINVYIKSAVAFKDAYIKLQQLFTTESIFKVSV